MRRRACKNCGNLIIKGRKDKEFCHNACRYTYWRDHPGDLPACYYCGMPADTIDHVPPQTVRPRLRELGIADRYPNHEIDACKECNTLLGARPLWILSMRKRFIKLALQKKYRKILTTKEFSDSEISQFGYNLKTFILGNILMAELIRKRIQW